MILRTVILLGLGAAQPAGLAMAAGPAAPQTSNVEAEVSAREVLARDLASWRVDLITQDEAAAVLTSLQSLVARAEALVHAEPEDEAQVKLLTDLYVEEFTQSERRLGLGPLRTLFLTRLSAAHSTDQAPAAVAMARASMAVVTPERIEQLISTAMALQTDTGSSSEALDDRRRVALAQMLAAEVEGALADGDVDFIREIGSAAVEPLADAALKVTGERVREGELDPLVLLATVDPAAALDVALSHVRNEDLLLKLRVVDAFTVTNPFTADSVWTPVPGGAFELRDPAWAEVVASFYQAPAVPVRRADPFLRALIRRGYAPLGLQSLVPASLTRLPLVSGTAWPVAVEAARELLSTETIEAQKAGLKVVMLSDSVAPAWALAASPKRPVRALLAKAFGPRQIEGVEVRPAADAPYIEALRVFLGVVDDGGPTAVSRLDPVAIALASAARLASAAQEGSQASGEGTQPPVLVNAATLIQVLERDPVLSPAALDGVLLHLKPLAPRERFRVIEAAAQAMLRVLKTSDTQWQPAMQPSLHALLGAAVETGDGEAFIHVFDEHADADAWRQAIETSRADSDLTRFSEHLPKLAPALQLQMIRALWRTGYDNFGWLDEDELSLRRDHWLSLAADRQLPRPARIWALEEMADEDGSPAPAGAAAQLAGIVAELGECPIGSTDLGEMGFDPEDYLNHLLDLPNASDEAVLDVYIELKQDSTVERLLERFPPSTWTNHRDAAALSGVIRALVRRRDPALNQTLIAANLPRTAIQSYLVRSIYSERFAGHLPLGGAILKSGVMAQDLAIDYVASFMSDDAARYLVEAMETARSESYREQLFKALQGLTERREVAERWMRSSDAAARHESAVRKLVAVIDTPGSSLEARAEAVKGLGLLDARDELPRLIGMLEANQELLRAAARAAIDRMGK